MTLNFLRPRAETQSSHRVIQVHTPSDGDYFNSNNSDPELEFETVPGRRELGHY